jgi:transcription elongation factor GreA
VERIAAARGQGDLAENSEYAAARDELSFIDGRIEELEVILSHVKVIREGSGHSGVKLGSRVTLSINGKKEEFTVVGEWEADPIAKKISHDSPLGKALLGKRVGDKAQVDAPAGKIVYSVVHID